MGLDITAYENISRLDCTDDDGDPVDKVTGEYIEDFCRVYVNPDFSDRADNLTDGFYPFSDHSDFCAGSYGGYNRWRELLAELAGYSPEHVWRSGHLHNKELPFRELVNFSDCEGTIGPVTSAKLAKDFAEYRDKAGESDVEWFFDKYDEWQKAFQMAANNGAVCFH